MDESNLKKWRTEHGKSQAEVAAEIGVSQPTICALEGGAVILGEVAAIKLERATGGAVRAIDCVRPSKRARLEELLQSMAQDGAA